MNEPAGTCYDCGAVGLAGERWRNSDLCDGCAYRADTRRWRPTEPVPSHGRGPIYPSPVCAASGCHHCAGALTSSGVG